MPSIYILSIIIATFFFMEFMAWFTHKFVMHGFLWVLHRDHHQKKPGFFEKNDSFFLIFAIPSCLGFIFGAISGFNFLFWMGFGIALYGLTYFMIHDVLIHRRFKWFKRPKNPYLLAIQKAHRAHHKHLGKEKGESFGMLIIPWKFYKEAKK